MTVLAQRKHKTIYRDGDKTVKVFDKEYSKADVLNEALGQARIEETGLNIPKLLGVNVIDGKWAIVNEYIEGKTLAELMAENPEKKDEYIELLVDIQMEVHSKKSPLLTKLKDKMNRKISLSSLDATTRYELHTRLEGMPKHNKVCHGDFNPSNIIITEDGTPYILDWSHVTQGNASADVARTYLLFCLNGDTEGAEKYLNTFCKKSDTAKQYVQKWMPIVAASQSVKGNEEEREFLLKWTDVVDPLNQRQMIALCEKYPNVKFIFAHIGRAYFMRNIIDSNIEEFSQYPNAYFDTAMINSADIMKYTFDHFPLERVLFGTDTPIALLRGKSVEINNQYAYLMGENYAIGTSIIDTSGVVEFTTFFYEQLRAMLDATPKADLDKLFFTNAYKLFTGVRSS